jgi:hypothetical protein
MSRNKLFLLILPFLVNFSAHAQPHNIFASIAKGEFPDVFAILEANPDARNAVDGEQNTLLHRAAEQGWRGEQALVLARHLLKLGADRKCANRAGKLPY